jgi:ParB/RepB/Spo0J family partition protein
LTPTYPATDTQLTDGAEYRVVPTADIVPSGLNPRRDFDEEGLAELAASIARHGLQQPIVVREATEGTAPYVIVMGERRWRAARQAGLTEVPVINRGRLTDAEHVELALVENLQRRDLSPIEEAEGYRLLHDVAGWTQSQIAAAVKRAQPTVATTMGLLQLPPDVVDMIRQGKLSRAHGAALARFKPFPAVASAIAGRAAARGTPARELERGLPFRDELLALRLAAEVRKDEPFDAAAVCPACPLGAFLPDETWNRRGWCLAPAEYRRRVREGQAARRAAKTEATERLAAAPPVAPSATAVHAAVDGLSWQEAARFAEEAGLPSLSDMPRGSYAEVKASVRLGPGESWCARPPTCTRECPCRRVVRTDWGGLEDVCVEPERLRSLVAEDQARRRRQADEREAAARARLEAALAPLEGPAAAAALAPYARAIALVAALVLDRSDLSQEKQEQREALLDRAGLGDLAEMMRQARRADPWSVHGVLRSPGGVAMLAEAPAGVLRAAVEWALRDEIADAARAWFADKLDERPQLTDWFGGGARPELDERFVRAAATPRDSPFRAGRSDDGAADGGGGLDEADAGGRSVEVGDAVVFEAAPYTGWVVVDLRGDQAEVEAQFDYRTDDHIFGGERRWVPIADLLGEDEVDSLVPAWKVALERSGAVGGTPLGPAAAAVDERAPAGGGGVTTTTAATNGRR